MKAVFVLLGIVVLSIGCAKDTSSYKQQSPTQQLIDLTQIPHLQPKGRIQDKDYNNIKIIDQLIAMETQAIPFLIDKLTDETVITHPVMDYWHSIAVGDVAFIILTDFFTDSSWVKPTVPGVSWDAMLGREKQDDSAEELLRKFISQHGRKGVKEKWVKIWNENRDKLYWDEKDRCFKLK